MAENIALIFPATTEGPINITAKIPECSGAIPGIASNSMLKGLDNFYLSYSKVHGYVAVAVCLFGVLSNSANIIVLTRRNMASSTNSILLWLAVADLLTMLDYLPFAIHFYITEPVGKFPNPFGTPEFSWICFLLFHASFSIVCHSMAIWLTIALAIFRYIYICKPTRGSYYCSQQRACFVIVAVIFLTILLCIPNYAVNTYTSSVPSSALTVNGMDTDQVNSTTAKPYFYPTLRQESPVLKITFEVNNWVQAILIKLVPCFMLVTLTLLLLHAMHKAYRKRLKLKSQGRRAESDRHGEHNRTTGMLLAVVILFTFTELPQGILTLMNIFVPCFRDSVYYKLGDLIDIMALINNSINFVLYCTMSKQFRTTFATIFCPQQSSRSKWLKLRLIKSHVEDSVTVETSDGGRKSLRGNNSEVISTIAESSQMTHVHSDLNCDEQAGVTEVSKSSDKLLLSPATNNGTATHTHGFSTDHSHV